MNAEGYAGELRVGWHRCARLQEWSLEAGTALTCRFDITSKVEVLDDYWITQKPMTLSLVMGQFQWVWENVQYFLNDGSASITVLGRPTIVRG